jgi:hypothetical protein
MKKIFLPILLSTVLFISCNLSGDQPVEIEEVEIINKFEETIFIAGLVEIESSNLLDPRPVINLDENDALVKLEPNMSQVFSTEEIVEYYPNADFRIFIYAFGVPEAEDPTKLVQLTSIYTVENDELVRNKLRIPVSK